MMQQLFLLLGFGTVVRVDLQPYQYHIWMLNNPVANEDFPKE